MARFKITFVVTLMAFLAAVAVWVQYDWQTSYMPVNARVSRSTTLCHIEKNGRKVVDKVDRQTIEVPCAIAYAAVETGQRWAGLDVVARTAIEYIYVSPVDRRSYAGNADHAAKTLQVGDIIEIRAHKKIAAKSRYAA